MGPLDNTTFDDFLKAKGENAPPSQASNPPADWNNFTFDDFMSAKNGQWTAPAAVAAPTAPVQTPVQAPVTPAVTPPAPAFGSTSVGPGQYPGTEATPTTPIASKGIFGAAWDRLYKAGSDYVTKSVDTLSKAFGPTTGNELTAPVRDIPVIGNIVRQYENIAGQAGAAIGALGDAFGLFGDISKPMAGTADAAIQFFGEGAIAAYDQLSNPTRDYGAAMEDARLRIVTPIYERAGTSQAAVTAALMEVTDVSRLPLTIKEVLFGGAENSPLAIVEKVGRAKFDMEAERSGWTTGIQLLFDPMTYLTLPAKGPIEAAQIAKATMEATVPASEMAAALKSVPLMQRLVMKLLKIEPVLGEANKLLEPTKLGLATVAEINPALRAVTPFQHTPTSRLVSFVQGGLDTLHSVAADAAIDYGKFSRFIEAAQTALKSRTFDAFENLYAETPRLRNLVEAPDGQRLIHGLAEFDLKGLTGQYEDARALLETIKEMRGAEPLAPAKSAINEFNHQVTLNPEKLSQYIDEVAPLLNKMPEVIQSIFESVRNGTLTTAEMMPALEQATKARAATLLSEGIANNIAKVANIPPPNQLTRIVQKMKAYEGLVFVGTNPHAVAGNILNNVVRTAMYGVTPWSDYKAVLGAYKRYGLQMPSEYEKIITQVMGSELRGPLGSTLPKWIESNPLTGALSSVWTNSENGARVRAKLTGFERYISKALSPANIAKQSPLPPEIVTQLENTFGRGSADRFLNAMSRARNGQETTAELESFFKSTKTNNYLPDIAQTLSKRFGKAITPEQAQAFLHHSTVDGIDSMLQRVAQRVEKGEDVNQIWLDEAKKLKAQVETFVSKHKAPPDVGPLPAMTPELKAMTPEALKGELVAQGFSPAEVAAMSPTELRVQVNLHRKLLIQPGQLLPPLNDAVAESGLVQKVSEFTKLSDAEILSAHNTINGELAKPAVAGANDTLRQQLTQLESEITKRGLQLPPEAQNLQKFKGSGFEGASQASAKAAGIHPPAPAPLLTPTAAGLMPPPLADTQATSQLQDILDSGKWADSEAAMIQDVLDSIKSRASQDILKSKGMSMPETLKAALGDWAEKSFTPLLTEAKAAANKVGEWTVAHTVLNYGGRFNIDDGLMFIQPFSFWPTHMALLVAQEMIDRPALFMLYHTLATTYDRMTKNEDFPKRFRGKLRIALDMPFVPAYLRGGLFIDPLEALYPVKQVYHLDDAQRGSYQSFPNIARLVRDLVASGQIDEATAQNAIAAKSGPIWDQATKQANAEGVDDNGQALVDFFSPHLPLKWAWSLMQGHPADVAESVAQIPFMRLLRGATAPFTPGGISPVKPKYDEYYTLRALGELLGEKQINSTDYNLALMEHKGKVWDKARLRAGIENYSVPVATGAIGFTGHSYSAGELKYGEARLERDRLINQLYLKGGGVPGTDLGAQIEWVQRTGGFSAGPLRDFITAHPELDFSRVYQEPEQVFKQYLIDNVWKKYMDLSKLQKKDLSNQFGSDFEDLFLKKPAAGPRNYDAITIEQLEGWANSMSVQIPKLVGGIPTPTPTAALHKFNAQDIADYQAFYTQVAEGITWEKVTALSEAYHKIASTDEAARAAFRTQHPDLVKFWNESDDFYREHPGVSKALGLQAPTTPIPSTFSRGLTPKTKLSDLSPNFRGRVYNQRGRSPQVKRFNSYILLAQARGTYTQKPGNPTPTSQSDNGNRLPNFVKPGTP